MMANYMNLNLDEFRYKMFWSNSHTGEHLATAIKAITTDWEIADKVVIMVVDNAANAKLSVNLAGFDLVCCSAHTLQLAIRDVLDEVIDIKNVLTKCRSIVEHFKRSNISKARLVEAQKEFKMKILKPIQEV
jgi:hypothetical protein